MQSQDTTGTISPSTPSPAVSESPPKQLHDGQDAGVAATADKPSQGLAQQDLASLPQLRTGNKGRKQRSEEERKARRRESNRISAKRMRQRRAESTSNLRKEVADLKRMNAALELDNNSRAQEFNSMKEQNERIKAEILMLEAELKEMSECVPEPAMLYTTPSLKAPPAPFSVGKKRPLSDIRSPMSTTSTKGMYDYPTTPEHISPAGLPSSQPSPPLTPLKQSYAPFSAVDTNMRESSVLSDCRPDGQGPPSAIGPSGHIMPGKLQTAKIGFPGRSLVLSPRTPPSPPPGASSSAWHSCATPGHLNKAQSSSLDSLPHMLRSEGSTRSDQVYSNTSNTRYFAEDKFGDSLASGSFTAAGSMLPGAERVPKVPRLEPLGYRPSAAHTTGTRPCYMEEMDTEDNEREDGAFWGAVRRSNGYQRATGWPEAAMSSYPRRERMMVPRTAPVRNC